MHFLLDTTTIFLYNISKSKNKVVMYVQKTRIKKMVLGKSQIRLFNLYYSINFVRPAHNLKIKKQGGKNYDIRTIL